MTKTIEIPVDDKVASALAVVRKYAWTFGDHPNKTTGNGTHHIANSEVEPRSSRSNWRPSCSRRTA